ncbi:dienelactone hydrolase family protein [Haliea sp. E17]|uniref:dienelactone hydrolase family protein n=1 Tax=Haliea sp. E17 TaxID=3401576 RepID=UPI003AACFE96
MGFITLKAADGFEFSAYEAQPEGAAKGAIVVIQEVFGVNSHIRSVVDGYASEGYYAVAPAIFDRVEAGVELGYQADDMQRGIDLAFNQLDMPTTLGDLQTAIDHAASHGKVGVVGYCFGGLLTWLCACNLNGVAAASAYYGGGIPDQAAQTPKCPIILHFGDKDSFIPMESVAAFKAKHPDLDSFVYAADHGFNCDQRGSYDAEAAKLALQRTLALFSAEVAA